MLEGQPLDLDHTNDRKGYLGFSHSKCNRATAGPNAMGYAEQQAKPSPAPRSVTQW